MIKEIKYNGYSATPSDYECPDGDLAMAMGLLQENGAMKPVLPPKVLGTLPENSKILYIHNTVEFTHYILDDASYLYWGNSVKGTYTKIDSCYSYGLKHINAVGNTLILFYEDKMEYVLWTNNSYKSLGDHLPNIDISFGLKGKPRFYSVSDESKSTFNISFNGISEGELFNTWTEENKTKITSQVMAKVNKFLREQTIDKGRFALPFFVRYALRLYDGSLVCHSAPILMNPSTKTAPIVFWTRASGKGSYTNADCDIMLVASSLDYMLVADADYDAFYMLNDWTDIIKSVDIFISKPIYTWNQEGECSSFNDTDNFDNKFIGAIDPAGIVTSSAMEDSILSPIAYSGGPNSIYEFRNYYVEWKYSDLYALYKNKDRSYPSTTINLPEFTEEKVAESLKNVSTFYKLCSIELSELERGVRKDITIDDDYLQSLVTREVMTDDYLTHERIIANQSFVYNSRLNLSGIKKELFKGFRADSLFAYKNHNMYGWEVDNSSKKVTITFPILGYSTIHISVYIKENGKVYAVSNTSQLYLSYFLSDTVYSSQEDANNGVNGVLNKRSWGCYVFYPNVNAFKMIIRDNSGSYEIDLKAHEFLNGAYGLIDYELQRAANVSSYPTVTGYTNIIDVANKIYTSEVNNPFYFPLLGINTVGTGNILGICAAAKALSEGQFGQFPLYAFTTEGVWALEVSSTGTYSAKQPITRDVCINPDSITQIDSAVLFATDRGIMHISGSTVQCISDNLNTEDLFSIADLPKCDKLIDIFNAKADDTEQITIDDVAILPFLDFLADCRMIYDYTNQRIIVYNPAVRYAYVYSMKSQTWGMMRSNIVDNVNSYPEALAMADGATLVDFSKSDAETTTSLIITRPFKIDSPDTFKTINTIIQRGVFRSTHVQQVLYGSNDLFNWHTVWSSVDKIMRGFRGTPYKAYRLALVCRFDKAESIYGCTVVYEPRMTNQVR